MDTNDAKRTEAKTIMDVKAIESKWQARWEKNKENVFNKKNIDKKWYVLEMFS